MTEVLARYEWMGNFILDGVAHKAAGRVPDFSGCGLGDRDLGWVCKSEIETEKIKRGLQRAGFRVEIKP
jgi:hypothetical protein